MEYASNSSYGFMVEFLTAAFPTARMEEQSRHLDN